MKLCIELKQTSYICLQLYSSDPSGIWDILQKGVAARTLIMEFPVFYLQKMHEFIHRIEPNVIQKFLTIDVNTQLKMGLFYRKEWLR